MAVYCGQYYQNIFSWTKYKIFVAKHKFQWPKPHVFVLSTCFHCQNTLRFGKHIFMGKVQHFYWQSMKFLWTNRYHPPRWRCSAARYTGSGWGEKRVY